MRPSDPVRPEFAVPRDPFVDERFVVHVTRFRDVVEVTELERAGAVNPALSVLRATLARHGMTVPDRVHVNWLFPWAQGLHEADGSIGRHKVVSDVLRRYLKRRAVLELTPVFEQHALDLLRAHVREQSSRGGEAGVIDVAGFAHALAFRSMSSLAGFPQAPEDEQFMLAQLTEFANRPDLMQTFEPEDPALREYFQSVVAQHATDGDGLLGEIASAHQRGAITLDERDGLIWGCWAAGTDTTATLINLLVGLIDEAGLRDTMVANLGPDGGEWRKAAINEAARFTPFSSAPQISIRDFDLASGFHVPEGCEIQLHFDAANRDPAVFGDDAGVFDPDRRVPRPNLAFGHGVHYCLGDSLARAETEIAAIALYENLPGLTVVDWQRTPGVVDLVSVNTAEYDLAAATRRLIDQR
jgi:cytochrome P450